MGLSPFSLFCPAIYLAPLSSILDRQATHRHLRQEMIITTIKQDLKVLVLEFKGQTNSNTKGFSDVK